MAFVFYDQTLTTSAGKTDKSQEYRVLVKTDSGWKIHAVIALYNYPKPERK